MPKYVTQEEVFQILTELNDPFGAKVRTTEAMRRISAIPAADVVEVRHERWDLAKDPFGAGYVKCSRCGYKHCPEYYPDGSAIMHLFCPSCGAKMDGGQDDG